MPPRRSTYCNIGKIQAAVVCNRYQVGEFGVGWVCPMDAHLASVRRFIRDIGWEPKTTVREGW